MAEQYEYDEDGRVIIEGQVIMLDACRYERVRFRKCVLQYCGLLVPTLRDCMFDGVQFMLDGPAERTVRFLSEVAKFGNGGDDLVRKFMESIIGGQAATSASASFSVDGPVTLQ